MRPHEARLALGAAEELGDHGGERREGEVGVVWHRRGVRAERQLRDDAAVAIPQATDHLVPQGAAHQHPVREHHDRPVAAGVGVHEAGGRRSRAASADRLAGGRRAGS